MVRARSWALTAVRAVLATWLGRPEQTVRQPWREFCEEATATRGAAPCPRAVEPGVVLRLAWGVGQGAGPPWALAREATPLRTRFPVLALRVV